MLKRVYNYKRKGSRRVYPQRIFDEAERKQYSMVNHDVAYLTIVKLIDRFYANPN